MISVTPTVAAQLAAQEQQEKAYGAAPFEPYIESPGGTAPATALSGPANPLVAHGRGIFEAHGCEGCHGPGGAGTSMAPALVGITSKFPGDQLVTLLHHPNAAMIAGHMPAVDASPADMSALLAYLAALGTPAANVPASHGVAAPESESTPRQTGRNAPEAAAVSEATPSPNTTDAGRQIFQQHGCAACHGPSGTGGRAPAIASLIGKRSDTQLLEALKVPNAKMKAGGMQPVAGTPVELSSLVAYLRTLNASPQAKQPANEAVNTSPTTPAAPSATEVPPAPAPATVAVAPGPGVNPGRAVFVSQGCAACHGANAGGTHFAPSLIGISAKFPGDALNTLLHHPNAKMRSGGMPPVTANPAEMKQLIAYLSSLSVSGAASPGVSGARTAPQSTAGKKYRCIFACCGGRPAQPSRPSWPTDLPTLLVPDLPRSGRLARHGCRSRFGRYGFDSPRRYFGKSSPSPQHPDEERQHASD